MFLMYAEDNLFVVMSLSDNLSLNLFLVYLVGFILTSYFNSLKVFKIDDSSSFLNDILP